MKILIIKLGALGDVVMATSLIHQIQDHHKNSETWLLTTPAYTDIFSGWGQLRVFCIDRGNLRDNLRALLWMRKSGFDRVYDLQSNDRTAVLCALSSIKVVVGNHPRFPYTIHPRDHYTGQCHIYDRMLEVLHLAGIDAHAEPPKLMPATAEQTQIRDWLQHHQLQEEPFVILHAGTSAKHPEKCWPYFAELAPLLAAAGYRVVWVGAGGDQETNRRLASIIGIDATGIFNINALAELGRHARFAVTNDSGPMHVLSASNIPVFALFGPTNWHRNHAIGQADSVIVAGNIFDKIFQPASLHSITVDQVLQKLKAQKLI